jgi:pyrroloquinoline quinone biosynthesis protein D
MIKLNQSAAEILKRCNGKRDVEEIVKDLEESFSATGLGDDVKIFLEEVNERGWLV